MQTLLIPQTLEHDIDKLLRALLVLPALLNVILEEEDGGQDCGSHFILVTYKTRTHWTAVISTDPKDAWPRAWRGIEGSCRNV